MRRLIIILLAAGCSSCAAWAGPQTPSPPASAPASAPSAAVSTSAPDGWVLYPGPPEDGPALRCANYSRREWRVATAGESLKISLDTPLDHRDPLPAEITHKSVANLSRSERRVIRVGDGWLVGIDAGEFGGALWWFSSDGRSSNRLADENVIGFAESSKGVLAPAGLAHMGTDAGKVLRITEGAAGRRKVETLADVGAAPMAFAAESPDALLVVTNSGLVRVRTSGVVEHLLHSNYQLLYPNSMTLSPSGVVHVGMRHFITRLTPSGGGYKEEWFVPEGCTRFSLRGYDCVCVPGGK
jgi:hypothetical protein